MKMEDEEEEEEEETVLRELPGEPRELGVWLVASFFVATGVGSWE